jgi:two-component system sensor histidine kinase YesM
MIQIGQVLSQLTLRTKLLASIVACLLIPSIIGVTISNYWTRDVVREQAGVSGQQAVNVSNVFITSHINTMIYISNNILLNPETNKVLRRLATADPNISDIVIQGQAITTMLETMAYSKYGMYITILLPNGYYFTNYSGDEFNPNTFLEEAWFGHLDKLSLYDVYWMGHQPTYIHSRMKVSPSLITLARTMKTDSKEPKPYVYVIISMEERQIGQFFAQYTQTQDIMLLDKEGNIISHSEYDQIGKSFLLHDQVVMDKASLVKQDGEDYLLQGQGLQAMGWKIVSLMPYKQAAEKIQSFRQTDFIMQMFALLTFILVMSYLVRQFTAPLRTLSQITVRVEMGDLSVRSNIRGQDEVGKLSRVFDRMLERIQEMIERIKHEQNRKRTAELKMLQAQINPHFLFNTLNSIRMKIFLKGDTDNAELIASLSSLLRMTIHRNETVTLYDEVETVRHYVLLMRIRQKETIEFVANLASDTLLDLIPRFTIQPIIENALIHGLKYQGGTITIEAWHDEGRLHLEIKDSGTGMSQEQLGQIREDMIDPSVEQNHKGMSGIGLSNVYERLKLLYGESFHIHIDSELGNGTRTEISLPIKTLEEERRCR